MSETTSEIASRCIEDPDFARKILEGDDYPEVRMAIIADLEADMNVEGYLNPCPLPPGEIGFAAAAWSQQGAVFQNWSALPRLNLNSLLR